jgi:NAD-dependent DNA ligase
MKYNKKTLEIIKKDPEGWAKATDINTLQKWLEVFRYHYYNTDAELISDESFDIIEKTLKKKLPSSSLLHAVGEKPEFRSVKLPFWMGSLDKVYPEDSAEVFSWKNKFPGPYHLTSKVDGVSGLFICENGQFKIYSRGNGTIGSDWSFAVPYINIPHTSTMTNLVVRGELIISKANFEQIKENYTHSRAMVNGLLMTKNNIRYDLLKYIDFVAYEVIDPPHLSLEKQYKLLKECNFITAYNVTAKDFTMENLKFTYEFLKSEYTYQIDGVVVCNTVYERNSDGNPDYCFAFKMQTSSQKAVTTVRSVEWNVSKDNFLKPTIILDPINIEGVTIERTTGFNAKYILDNGIGKGAVVEIIRSGDVIPYVSNVLKKVKPDMPTVPCNWNSTKIDLVAINESQELIIQKLIHFFSTVKVKGLSEGIITKFVEHGKTDVIQILTFDVDEVKNWEGMGTSSAQNIKNEIDKVTTKWSIHEIMAASNLFGRGMGSKKLKLIVENVPDWELLPNEELYESIMKLQGFDTKTTNLFINGVESFKKFLKQLKDRHLFQYKSIQLSTSSHLFKDKKIVVTGFRDSVIENFIIHNSGEVLNSVSSNTSFVIRKDEYYSNTKTDKAKQLGISVVTLKEFKSTYGLQ